MRPAARKISLALASLLVAIVFVPVALTMGTTPAVAATGSDFKPGNIISDANFFNGTAMSEAEIQSWMSSQNSGCQSGYTCLPNYTQTTFTRAADAMCNSYTGGTNETSARIIAKVAQACNISPRVLLVTLQKEQSLVTSTAPSDGRYGAAMGFACPDTAACDAQYFGFYNQVYKSAWQFKRYANPAGTSQFFTWYPVGQTSNVRFSPDSNCGTSPVYIENQATAGLYYYTPYQPNAAALSNLYGTGDGCSAYGNRNFWRLYTDWFGSTTDAPPNPFGSLDSATGGYTGITVSGWAVDPNSPSPAYVWVNIDGQGGPALANTERSWFNGLYPGYGTKHGFDVTVAKPPGTYRVCVTNSTTGVLIGCQSVTIPIGDGSLDSVTQEPDGFMVKGWGIDFRTVNPIDVKLTVDGVPSTSSANAPLNWLNGYYPGIGSNHGFAVKVLKPVGTHTVCADLAFRSLGCKTVTTTRDEVGSLDSLTATPNKLRLTGWGLDTSMSAPAFIWVDVDGRGSAYRAASPLSWFNGAFPGAGANHGFDLTLAQSPGTHRVCVFGAGTSKLFGCKTVTVPALVIEDRGSFDSLTPAAGGFRMSGWAYNTATTAPTYIWVSVDGAGTPYKAANGLSWFEGVFPGAGTSHGFDVTVPASPGVHTVCIQGASTGASFGCKSVTVARPTPPPAPSPTPPAAAAVERGSFDSLTAVSGGLRATGWAYDTSTKNPIYIWIDVDGTGVAAKAANSLSWFEGVFPGAGLNHGFDVTIPKAKGSHRVCVYAAVSTLSLGCKTVTVN